jgi:PTS system nitrogen regulatory IIA component
MIKITELIVEERILLSEKITSKKRVLELLSESIAVSIPELTAGEIFDCLVNRERLGSTGLGHGVAIPHGRLKNVSGPIAAFLKLQEGVDYDAVDSQPVDLFCALLVPTESTDEHLQILALLAEMFSDIDLCTQLRAARTSTEIHALLKNWQPLNMGQSARRAHN